MRGSARMRIQITLVACKKLAKKIKPYVGKLDYLNAVPGTVYRYANALPHFIYRLASK